MKFWYEKIYIINQWEKDTIQRMVLGQLIIQMQKKEIKKEGERKKKTGHSHFWHYRGLNITEIPPDIVQL